MFAACQQSVDRTLQCALHVPRRGGVGGRVGTEGESRERRAGLAGCGLKWQQIVLDHSKSLQFNWKAAACCTPAAYGERRSFESREAAGDSG